MTDLNDAWEDWITKADLTPELEEELRELRKGARMTATGKTVPVVTMSSSSGSKSRSS